MRWFYFSVKCKINHCDFKWWYTFSVAATFALFANVNSDQHIFQIVWYIAMTQFMENTHMNSLFHMLNMLFIFFNFVPRFLCCWNSFSLNRRMVCLYFIFFWFIVFYKHTGNIKFLSKKKDFRKNWFIYCDNFFLSLYK